MFVKLNCQKTGEPITSRACAINIMKDIPRCRECEKGRDVTKMLDVPSEDGTKSKVCGKCGKQAYAKNLCCRHYQRAYYQLRIGGKEVRNEP